MSESDGVVFIYRSHYDGLLGKRVRWLPDRTVLDWFRRGWAATADPSVNTYKWVASDLGGSVYGLNTIFEAARKLNLPAPENSFDLTVLLNEHLYVEDRVLVEDGRVLALTDDDEVQLAYFFLDRAVVEQAPERLAYLLHDEFPLPSDAVDGAGGFVPPVEPGTLRPAGTGEGTTYAVLLTFYDSDSMCWLPALEFPGVRLPGLAGHLRAVQPAGGSYSLYADGEDGTGEGETEQEAWPRELLVLRALVAPGETSIEPALRRCNRYPSFEGLDRDGLAGPHATVHPEAMAELDAGGLTDGRKPELTRIDAAEHIAQMSMHANKYFGHQQWFLFDDVWAASHPQLAGSLIRYAQHWNPLG